MNFLNNWTIELEKLPKYSDFRTKFSVPINKSICDAILNSTNPDFTQEMKAELRNNILPNLTNNTLKFTHYQNYEMGRFRSHNSLVNLSKRIKHTIFHFHKFRDLDQIKGHPTIAIGVGDLNNVDFKGFKNYVNNFETIRDVLINYYSLEDGVRLTEGNIKDLFNVMIYGGSINTWIKDLREDKPNKGKIGFQINEELPLHKHIIDFKQDCHKIRELIVSNNPAMFRILKDEKKDEKTDYDIGSSVISYWFQIIENHSTYLAYSLLVKKGIISKNACLPEFDGLCIPPSSIQYNDEKLLIDLNREMMRKMNIPIKYKFKGYEAKNIYQDIINSIKPVEEDDFIQKCEEFEKKHAKIINRAFFIKEEDDKVIILSETQLTTAYKHISSVNTFGNPQSFISRWLNCNDDIRRYDDIDIYPEVEKCPKNIYNKWRPFAMEFVPFVDNKSYEVGKQIILNHIKILCGNDVEVYNYFIAWIGQMIQYPSVKTICPTLISDEGSGKGSLLRLLSIMLGINRVLETTDPSRDVWGNFNGVMADCFLVNLNELSKKDTTDSMGKIKGLITDNKLMINGKGTNQYPIQSYHRFIITTNKEDPIETKKGDRRNLIIRSSDEKKGDDEYFDKLHEYLNDIGLVRYMYEYFKTLKGLDKFHKMKIPETEYQNNLKQLTRKPEDLWLEDLTVEMIDKGGVMIKKNNAEVFNLFSYWCDKNGYSNYQTTSLKLAVRLSNMETNEGVVTSKGKTFNSKIFYIDRLAKHYNIGIEDEK